MESSPTSPSEQVFRLARLIEEMTPQDGNFELGVSGITLTRRSQTTDTLQQGLLRSSVCIVAQGAKRILLEQEIFDYDESQLIASSVDIPVAAQILRASKEKPFLCIRLTLDPEILAPLVLKVYPEGLPPSNSAAVGVAPTEPRMIDTAIRLIETLKDPQDTQLLAPLVTQELLIRLLQSPIGPRIAQIGVANSGVLGVSRAISWLRTHFAEQVRTEDLAQLAFMSVSSFHQHFREVTALTPLQFQKALRLQEARNYMLTNQADAGSAGLRVGYVSPSQFSREYRRYFGQSPTRDRDFLREQKLRYDQA